MKKLTLLGFSILSFLLPVNVFAAAAKTPNASTDIIIVKPTQGFATLGDFIGNVITISFAVAILVVLVMLIWGAFEWITSGGDKETVGKARGRIINALIGLAVLAVAFALTKFAGQFLGFDITQGINVPTPNPSASGF